MYCIGVRGVRQYFVKKTIFGKMVWTGAFDRAMHFESESEAYEYIQLKNLGDLIVIKKD